MKKRRHRSLNLKPWNVEVSVQDVQKTVLTFGDPRRGLTFKVELETWQWTRMSSEWLKSYSVVSEQQKVWLDRNIARAKGAA